MKLEAVDVAVDINEHPILRGESVICSPGTMTALVGPSGSGKTTLLHCLGMLQSPTGGHVLVDGARTNGWTSRRRRRFWREHASFMLQDYGIMVEESVAFNVTMAARLWGRGAAGDAARLQTALSATGLESREHESAAHLSGGERQRLAVARAVYKRAAVILVDEPTASLDDANRDLVIELFRERAREGCTVVIATHDATVIDACAWRHTVGLRHPGPNSAECGPAEHGVVA